MSIWSYPERGKWGNSSYRGNASGHLYRDLYSALCPSFVIDPCMGSGTSIHVAQEMGIEALGLDLRNGFNLLRDSILTVAGKPADLVISHFPYHDMIIYSGHVYPEVYADDLSRCANVDDFLEKAQQALLNQRDATKDGGYYATLIGDHRKNSEYRSYQAEFIARMPSKELCSVIIKAQHNCMSDKKTYRNIANKLPRIQHEYLIVWQKPKVPQLLLLTLREMASASQKRITGTWKAVVRQAMSALGGQAALSDLYRHIEGNAPERVSVNPNWKAKVRQTLQLCSFYENTSRGVWRIAA